ncbi:CMGC/DYRK/YAK protein kinase, variant [Aphanomyces astaci]|uniref:CMGC/DYRK/YAK protein kinase, variant n=1 Tax=Aphanomyces astaci TaxID=112090 RepID=W4GQL2_APHAT|nr:CMGC/DYRK/YAK protein kinase, variant [Aphanomyces astaci]ETV81606.1 CMGC/DYRK/YAK protein kinase, variant [Aphanomyces astaci]|eukprot:XP_009829464.1 CMGC/DYRK/YAK protein kinase, variant [Aphanomyces astaci]
MSRSVMDGNHSHSDEQSNDVARRDGRWRDSHGEAEATARGHTVLAKLTTHLVDTYSKCGLPRHEQPKTARRLLTKNSQVVANNGWDNCDNNIVLRVRDLLDVHTRSGVAKTFVVLDLLGQGTFGQVFRCQDVATKAVVAIKIIRNHPSYYKQALVEVQVSQLLTSAVGMEGQEHVVELLDSFMFQNHLCLVFELLSVNLFELLSQNNFRGLPLTIVRGFLHQMLRSLVLLNNAQVIHCDLKPENILLTGQDKLHSMAHPSQVVPSIKLVDFGSACYENETVFSYIQSRFYRSPEVLLGLPYCGAIDMWSLGCVSAEMYLGLPLFPGASDHDQLKVIVDTLGYPPLHMVQQGSNLRKFFNITSHSGIVLKTAEEYARDCHTTVASSKRYFKHSALPDIINAYPIRRGASADEVTKERHSRAAFCDFLRGLLQLDPQNRWTPQQALDHPFLSGRPYIQPYEPATHRRRNIRFRSPIMPMHQPYSTTPPLSTSAPLPPYFQYHPPMYSHSCPFPQRELPQWRVPRPHSRLYHQHHQHQQHPHHTMTSHASCCPPPFDHWDPFFMHELDDALAAPRPPSPLYSSDHVKKERVAPRLAADPTTDTCDFERNDGNTSNNRQPTHRKWRRRRKKKLADYL